MWQKFLEWLSSESFECGSLAVGQGKHELEIKTDRAPCEVYLGLGDQSPIACVGNLDFFSYTLLPNGFVINVNISSPAVEIKYLWR
jgi:hypothetical protein